MSAWVRLFQVDRPIAITIVDHLPEWRCLKVLIKHGKGWVQMPWAVYRCGRRWKERPTSGEIKRRCSWNCFNYRKQKSFRLCDTTRAGMVFFFSDLLWWLIDILYSLQAMTTTHGEFHEKERTRTRHTHDLNNYSHHKSLVFRAKYLVYH